jgi:RNA polymerase sigma-70 factor (ECF subfamily)
VAERTDPNPRSEPDPRRADLGAAAGRGAEGARGPDPDGLLVQQLASDDPAVRRRALGTLFERHQGRVYNTAYRVLGSAADAQDVTQEVFLHVADRIRSFRGDASLTSWVYRVTVNLAIDARRRKARRPMLSSGARDEPDPEVGSTRPGVSPPPGEPGDALERSEADVRVREALDRLSPKLRAVVVLRYLEGLSYEDLADVLQMSIGTVKSRLSRAHGALERILGPYVGRDASAPAADRDGPEDGPGE